MSDDAIELIEMQPLPPVIGPGEHVHLCPECYTFQPCAFACSCFEGNVENGVPHGSPALCAECAPCIPLSPAEEARAAKSIDRYMERRSANSVDRFSAKVRP